MTLLLALLFQSKRIVQTAPTNVSVLDIAKRLINQKPDQIAADQILIIINEKRRENKALITDAIAPYVLSRRVHNLLLSVSLRFI